MVSHTHTYISAIDYSTLKLFPQGMNLNSSLHEIKVKPNRSLSPVVQTFSKQFMPGGVNRMTTSDEGHWGSIQSLVAK